MIECFVFLFGFVAVPSALALLVVMCLAAPSALDNYSVWLVCVASKRMAGDLTRPGVAALASFCVLNHCVACG